MNFVYIWGIWEVVLGQFHKWSMVSDNGQKGHVSWSVIPRFRRFDLVARDLFWSFIRNFCSCIKDVSRKLSFGKNDASWNVFSTLISVLSG